jgi:hypothetical protein
VTRRKRPRGTRPARTTKRATKERIVPKKAFDEYARTGVDVTTTSCGTNVSAT